MRVFLYNTFLGNILSEYLNNFFEGRIVSVPVFINMESNMQKLSTSIRVHRFLTFSLGETPPVYSRIFKLSLTNKRKYSNWPFVFSAILYS